LLKYGRSLALIIEDFDAVALCDVIPSNHGISLTYFFDIALQLVDGLSVIHQSGVIHAALSSSNIVIQQTSGVVKIIDFALSTKNHREFQHSINLKQYEHLLAYISPEQTGRMNRDIDTRTDFYSLGVVFYELLCGHVPFSDAGDLMEIVYCHIAKIPIPPHLVNSDVPKPISDIVMQLLAKNSDDRYQSIYGIKMDLITCKHQLNVNEYIDTQFAVRTFDVSPTFRINQRLYGRENEIIQLQRIFNLVSRGTVNSSLLLVYGYSGIGKTSLINEIHRPLIRDRGYFISGKFDQFKRNIPYFSIIQAFRQLVLLLLTEPEAKILYWKTKLLEVLGTRGQVIIDVIPEVELIIGPQPTIPVLGPIETQNRFNNTFLQFVQVFSNRSHPLVIFLDDLQWCDSPTLNLLELMVCSDDIQYLLVIGAYRDNEVNDMHSLSKTLNSIESVKPIHRIALDALDEDHVNSMISDSLNCSKLKTEALAHLVYIKTRGNPFFVILFLNNLVQENLIYFDHKLGVWKWVDDSIIEQHTSITDNVVDMTLRRIQKLPADTQNLLYLAACIGSNFELKLLSLISGMTMRETLFILYPAIHDGLVLKISGDDIEWLEENSNGSITFSFLHDRVQQAAYEQGSHEERELTHLKLGRLMLNSSSNPEQDDSLFDILSHFRYAKALIQDDQERLELAELLLQAGKRAKASTAYHPAANHLAFGVELLPPDCWESQYNLTYNLYKDLSETEYLRLNRTEAERLYPYIVERARTDLEKIDILMIWKNQLEQEQKYSESINLMYKCLSMLGVYLPNKDAEDELKQQLKIEIENIPVNLRGRNIRDLINEKHIDNPTDICILNLLLGVWVPAYILSCPSLLNVVSFKLANFCLTHGVCETAGTAFAMFSMISGPVTNDLRAAWEFGQLGVRLSEKYGNLQAKSRSYTMFGCGSSIFCQPIKESLPYLIKGFEMGSEAGDLAYTCYACHYIVLHGFLCADDLSQVEKTYEKYITGYLKQVNDFVHKYSMAETIQFRYLRQYNDPNYDEEFFKPTGSKLLYATYLYGRIITAYLMEEKDQKFLLDLAARALEIAPTLLAGTFKVIDVHFYVALTYLSVLDQSDLTGKDKQKYEHIVEDILIKMKYWSECCEANVICKYLLIQAEKARVACDYFKSIELYEAAIESARKYSSMNDEALANELCGKMWIKKNKLKYAKIYLSDAYYLYDRLGAVAKVQQLKENFSSVLELHDHVDIQIISPTKHIESSISKLDEEVQNSSSPIDVATVMKASQAIYAEQKLDEFLDSMMKLVIENSGAQNAIFTLAETYGKLLVVAEGSIDNVIVDTIRAIPLENFAACSHSIVNFVARTKDIVILGDCSSTRHQFDSDPYFQDHQIRSVLCMPIIKQESFKGVLYLENNLMSNAFTEQRTKVLGILSTQMALALENAKFATLLESEKKYRALAAELEARKKSLEEFIDVLCHELRNPLNAIYGNTTLINDLLLAAEQESSHHSIPYEKHMNLIQDVKESVSSISTSAYHLKDIVDTVLNISSLENREIVIQAVPFKPNAVIGLAVNMFKTQLNQKHLTVGYEFAPDSDIVVMGDAYRFKEILINLLSNSIKFTMNGTITIFSSFQEKPQDDQKVLWQVRVKDTGIGLSNEEQQRLFKAFSQASSQTFIKYGGSGLGLKICKDIVKLMNGDIYVESEKDRGSEFVFTVELERVSVEAEKAESEDIAEKTDAQVPKTNISQTCASSSASTTRKRILIAEDNQINAKLLSRILNIAGHETTIVHNGLEAVKSTESTPFDLILMDIEMPIMGGLEAALEIRRVEQERGLDPIPIIGVSANARKEYSEEALRSGLQFYITKPYLKEDVYDAVKKWAR
jgi:predicted ATPase/CheY-like chemotaxis protein